VKKSAGRADDELTTQSRERTLLADEPPRGSRREQEDAILHGKFRVLGLRIEAADELVYKALHLGTGRRVQLHVLREGVGANSGAAQRMLRAARAAGRAPHSNVLNIVDSGLDIEHRPFAVYEQFGGVTCAELVEQRGPCDMRLAVAIVSQVLDGLTALHTRGVFHRQIRPENVLVEGGADDVRVKLTGLGYAALRDRADDRPELPRGYSRYLAPEARRRDETVGPHGDIYATGVLLRFLLSGDSAADCDLPAQLERAIARATADDPDERFVSPDQFHACMGAIVGPTTRTSIVPSGSLLSDLRFLLQRREAYPRTSQARASAPIEHYPVLLMIESLYARIGSEGWRALLQHVAEIEQLLPAAGRSAELRSFGVPSALVCRMLAQADQLGRGDLRLVAELGEELARRGLQRFCAALPMQLTPECLVACVPALWRSIARDGEVFVSEQRCGIARLSLRGQSAPELELSALFAGLLRGQLRALSPAAEVNLVAAEALGDGADLYVLSW
jgi:hypothetical protein